MRRCIDTIVHDQAQGPVPVGAAPPADLPPAAEPPPPAADHPDPKPVARRKPAAADKE